VAMVAIASGFGLDKDATRLSSAANAAIECVSEITRPTTSMAFGSLLAACKHAARCVSAMSFRSAGDAISSAAYACANSYALSTDRVDEGEAMLSTSFSTSELDGNHSVSDMQALPLWLHTKLSGAAQQRMEMAHLEFKANLRRDPNTEFWHRWYSQMWDGTFRDWDLAIEVAKLPDDLWEGEDAPGKVAVAIREIEARLAAAFDRPDSVPELQQKKLLQHVQRLLASPDMTVLAAEGAADTLERAIAQYLKEAPANCLPDALTHLENVPPLFRRIAATVQSTERAEAKANRLATDIEALNVKIARLEADLRDARARTVHGLFTQSALKAAGATFGTGLVGSLGLAVGHFFGEWPSDTTLENFRGWLYDLETAAPKVEAQTLPPDYEV
ncbi:MAG: hypothetical protein AAGK77_06985, partial [Pseudomonadota bacterium]